MVKSKSRARVLTRSKVSMYVETVALLFIRNYKALNTDKFKIINEIENKFMVKPFNEEWEGLTANKKVYGWYKA